MAKNQNKSAVTTEAPPARRSHVILIRNRKTGTLHALMTKQPGVIAEFEDQEQALATLTSTPACQNNPAVVQEVEV